MAVTARVPILIFLLVAGTGAVMVPGQNASLEGADAALRAGEYAAARKGYESLVAEGPGPEPARVGMLRTLYETGAYREASELAETFVTQFPSPALSCEAGLIAWAIGDLRHAEAHLRQSHDHQGPASVYAARELADLLNSQGKRSEARVLWEEILRQYRAGRLRGSDALGQAAVAAWRLGYARDAKEIFLDATDEKVSGPVSPRSLADFGFLFLEKYNSTDAMGVFRDCLKINGRYPPALLGMARAGMFESSPEAERQARAALEQTKGDLAQAILLLSQTK